MDHAQYIANWLEVLKGDTKAIFSAASQATRAVEYLNSLQPGAKATAAPDDGPPRPSADTSTHAPRAVRGPK